MQQPLVAYSKHIWKTPTNGSLSNASEQFHNTYLNNICPIKTVYAINSENPFLLGKYFVIGDPKVPVNIVVNIDRKKRILSKLALASQKFVPYY